MGEVDKRPGPCLLCRSKDEPSFQDLPSHIRTILLAAPYLLVLISLDLLIAGNVIFLLLISSI